MVFKMIKEIKGLLHGYFETGTEGTMPAIQEFEHISEDGKSWSYDGLHVIDPEDHLTIIGLDGEILFNDIVKGYLWKDNDDGKVFIDEPGFSAGWMSYPLNPNHGQLQINGYWVHYIPTNIDIKLWWDVFFKNDGKYSGILRKREE